MRGSRGIVINGEALRTAIDNRNLTFTEIANRLGLRDQSTFSKYVRRNRIQRNIIEGLEEYFGIPFSEYAPEEGEVIELEKKSEKKLIRNSTRIDIDGMKLRQILIDKELSASYVSRELGYCDNHISSICIEDKISKPTLKALELRFGITYDDIKFDEPEPEPEPVEEEKKDDISGESNPVSIDMDRLYETIFSATYKAMKQALTESVNELTIIQQDKLNEKRRERRTYRSMHPEMFGDKPAYDIKEGY